MTPTLKKTFGMLMMALSLVALSACTEQEGNPANLSVYDGDGFTINVNPNWKVIAKSEFYSEIPKETAIAFTAPEAINGFYPNINVIRENLERPVSATDYAQANINLANQNLTDYEKIQEAVLNDEVSGQTATIHIFLARLNPSSKLARFVQLYTAKNNTGYIVSGGMLPDTPEDIRNELGKMVTSFRLK